MAHLQKLRAQFVLKCVSSNFVENHLRQSKPLFWSTVSFYVSQNPKFYGTKNASKPETCEILDESWKNNTENGARVSRAVRREAQAALLEYLHSTRSLQFTDAENMSKNSPHFLEKLLKNVEIEGDIGRSITRFLRYHPINEFEPFFESLGLKPSEFISLLPRDLMFLNDDYLLLENYHVLCNYGIARNKIGKIYKEATEAFRYKHGVLPSKLRSYEDLGLSQSSIGKIITSSPYLLVGDANVEFSKVLERLKSVGFEWSSIEGYLLEGNSYNWRQMLGLLCLFSKIGYSKEQLGALISDHPGILFEGSGGTTLLLIGFLLKFGSTMNEMHLMFLQFPQIQVANFVLNLRRSFLLLNEIEMEVEEIGRLVRSHPLLFGSCTLKRTNSLLANLNIGKKRLRQIIKENPQEIKNWVMGTRVKSLPKSGEDIRSRIEKTKFLQDLGFAENSNKMNEALKVFRGRGAELQERFDCLVKAGLDRNDVIEMIKVSPQILNQTREVIEMKIDFLVNGLGYPISTLVSFPSYLSYTIQRVSLRLSMYNWLKDQGTTELKLALSTVVACSDSIFVRQYVNHHPRGPEVWEDYKKQFYSE